MNSYVVNNIKVVIFGFLTMSMLSCMKPEPIYEVEPLLVQVQGGQKNGVKTDRQFVSGAYADVIKKQISTSDLNEAIQCYLANSDKEMIQDMIIRGLLKRTSAVIPSSNEMRNDPEKFVTDTYRRFYKRDPSDLERWTVQNQITQDTSLLPVMIYYAFMSAEEYKYF